MPLKELTWEEIHRHLLDTYETGSVWCSAVNDANGNIGAYILVMPSDLGQIVAGAVEKVCVSNGYTSTGSFGPEHNAPNN